MNSKEIIRAIREGGRKGEKVIGEVYLKYKKKIGLSLTSYSIEDFNDCYHKAMLEFIERVLHGTNVENIGGYLYRITRNCCNTVGNTQKRKVREKEKEWEDVHLNDSSQFILSEEDSLVIDQFKSLFGSKCTELVFLSQSNWSMDDIAKKLGYKNGNAAKTAKYKCLAKSKRILERHPNLKKKIDDIWNSMN